MLASISALHVHSVSFPVQHFAQRATSIQSTHAVFFGDDSLRDSDDAEQPSVVLDIFWGEMKLVVVCWTLAKLVIKPNWKQS